MATYGRDGSVVVELLIPFETRGVRREQIRFRPYVWDYTLRWQAGEFKSSVALLAAMTNEDEMTLRMLRYPDVDRVMSTMMVIIPDSIRNDILEGRIPVPEREDMEPSEQEKEIAAAEAAGAEAGAEASAAAAEAGQQFQLDDDIAR